MLITAVQQSESVMHIYIYTFFSMMVYHGILNIVPCDIQYDLVVYPSYIYSDCISNSGSELIAFGTSPGGRTLCCFGKLAALPLLPNEMATFVLCCSVQVLTLASNERIALTPSMRLLFEVHHLRTATPATVSRAGILYVNPQDLGWNP